jgi:multidrug efflux pump subunit AcrA (membrane-fusion protein)
MRATGRRIASLGVSLWFLAGGVLLLVVVNGHQSGAAPPGLPAATVATAKPARKTVRRTLDLPGQVEACEQARVYARIVGYVEKVHADIGDRVKKGDVLAELAVPERAAELKQKRTGSQRA